MAITSLSFLVFIAIIIIVYYVLPNKESQWIWLLAASLFFYLYTGINNIIYILITAGSSYFATRFMEYLRLNSKKFLSIHKDELTKEQRKSVVRKCNFKRKSVMIVTLLLNFGILCMFKYLNFLLEQINALANCFTVSASCDLSVNIIIPLGISFYTFQTMGYLVDVYWEKIEVEHNFAKVLLFVSFFPQITQGPISNYRQLSGELFRNHEFQYKNYSYGCQRMIWGFFKKMVIADSLAPFVRESFQNYSEYSGISILLSAFMYSVQIYADFSGYMDIVCGFSEILDIQLTENFERPYFSKSIAEYWRRWHISLGAWFKTYIYYPVAVAKWNRNFGKFVGSKLGSMVSKTLPASIALVVTWFVTGLWHGASWSYIAWGLVNGFFIIFSLWMEPIYQKVKEKMRIDETKKKWLAFQVIRTFILVTFIKVLPEVGTLSEGIGYLKQIFINHNIPLSLAELIPGYGGISDLLNIMVVILGIGLMIIVSIIQRKQKVRDFIQRLPKAARWVIYVSLMFMIIVFGTGGGKENFMYAQF